MSEDLIMEVVRQLDGAKMEISMLRRRLEDLEKFVVEQEISGGVYEKNYQGHLRQ